MLIVFFYAVLGGMKGITYTQIAQFCVLIFAYTVPAIFISLQLTGQPIPQLGLGSTWRMALSAREAGSYIARSGFSEYDLSRGSTLNMAAFTASLMIGTAGLPHVIIRFFTVPTVQAARIGGLGVGFIAILYTTARLWRLWLGSTSFRPWSQPGQHLLLRNAPHGSKTGSGRSFRY